MSTHSFPSTTEPLTVEQIRAERIALGLPPDKPVIPCHLDRNPDREHYRFMTKEAHHVDVA